MQHMSHKLREEFYNETGSTWINGDGEPDIDYVYWLEKIAGGVQNAPNTPSVSKIEKKEKK